MYDHDSKTACPSVGAVCYRRRFQIKVWAIYLSLADLTSLLQTRGTSKNTFELATNKLLQVASGFSDKRAQAREMPLRIETCPTKNVLSILPQFGTDGVVSAARACFFGVNEQAQPPALLHFASLRRMRNTSEPH